MMVMAVHEEEIKINGLSLNDIITKFIDGKVNEKIRQELMEANAFIVEKGLVGEFKMEGNQMRCDDCEFLSSNGICGYCLFTYECYDGKTDLSDDNRLPNCPLRTKTVAEAVTDLINKKDEKIRELYEIISFKDDKINLLKKCLKHCL